MHEIKGHYFERNFICKSISLDRTKSDHILALIHPQFSVPKIIAKSMNLVTQLSVLD